MLIAKRVFKNKAFELIVFDSGWDCVFDLMTNLVLGRKHDHPGFFFCVILFGYKILEFNFYDIRHSAEDNNE